MVQGIFGVEIIMLIQWDGKKVIADYIRNQLEEDYASDQISLKEYMDPFTGSEKVGKRQPHVSGCLRYNAVSGFNAP